MALRLLLPANPLAVWMLGALALFGGGVGVIAEDAALAPWRHPAVRAVAPVSDRHVIHSYFNTPPESPDGKHVLYYTSATPEGEQGDIRILERATGKETILASNITTEDAHRVACQQWSAGGKRVVYHDCKEGRWRVVSVDIATLKSTTLAEDRQLGFGAPASNLVPIYGCHWNPGAHRDLQLVNVETGEVRTIVTAAQVVKAYDYWIEHKFGSTAISLFFPVMSPDGSKVFFKLAHPGGGSDFRSAKASLRDGFVLYDLKKERLVRLVNFWGHPSWTPDSTAIFEKGNRAFDVKTGGGPAPYALSCFSDHPSLAPGGKVFVTDGDVSKRSFGRPNEWAIAIGSTTADEYVIVDQFDNSKGATSWRHNHPHPAFSPDGARVYYNVNDGKWTKLKVAEARE